MSSSGKVVAVLEEWCPRFPGLMLYYPGHRHVPPALRAFVDVLKEVEPEVRAGRQSKKASPDR